MRLFARLLLALLAFTASVPACATMPATGPAIAPATAMDHGRAMHHPHHDGGKHHDCPGATCIGCAIELPRDASPAPLLAWATLPAFGPIALQLDGRGPPAATPPPRILG